MKCPQCASEAWINMGRLPMSIEHRWKCSKCGNTLIGQKHRFIKSENSSKWLFQTGAPRDLKLMGCPGCGEHSCHWIGGSPHDIECLNEDCNYFKLPPECKKKQSENETVDLSEEETEDLTDFSIYIWFRIPPDTPIPEVKLSDWDKNFKPRVLDFRGLGL